MAFEIQKFLRHWQTRDGIIAEPGGWNDVHIVCIRFRLTLAQLLRICCTQLCWRVQICQLMQPKDHSELPRHSVYREFVKVTGPAAKKQKWQVKGTASGSADVPMIEPGVEDTSVTPALRGAGGVSIEGTASGSAMVALMQLGN